MYRDESQIGALKLIRRTYKTKNADLFNCKSIYSMTITVIDF